MHLKILNINELNIDEISQKVSKERLEKSEKYRFDTDKRRSIAVEYLLNCMIEEYKYGLQTPAQLIYDKHGKPHIFDSTGKDIIHFSLSHSGDYVACIISDRPCGIDIEKHSEKRDYEKIAKRICTASELKSINSKTDFYNVWTMKESVLKAVGLGLALDMRDIEVFENYAIVDNKHYIGSTLDAPDGYSLSYIEKEN